MNPKSSSLFQDSNNLILTLKQKFLNIYRVLYEVDPKEADRFQSLNHYYFEKYHENNPSHSHEHDKNCNHEHESAHKKTGCHGHDHDELNRKFFIPEKERSFIHQLLYERLKDYKLQEVLPDILDSLAEKFENIKKNGIKDKLEWTEETEKFVLSKVLTEGFTKALAQQIKKEIQRDLHVDSKQPLLLATPQSWYERFPKIKLDFLQSSTIANLLEKGYSVQQNFVEESGFAQTLSYEVMYFYHEGRFEAPSAAEEDQRNDKSLSFHFSDIDPKTSKHLYHICKLQTAIPFELNLKANIYAQAAESFQLSYFDKEGFQKIHYDSSFQEKYDNGKKISALYIFSAQSSDKKPKLTLYKEQSREPLQEIELDSGSIVLLKSRLFPYALSDIPAGTFVLRYWINGPADRSTFKM